MITSQTIIFACWIIFLGYWLINWTRVKPSKSNPVSFFKIRLIGAAIIIAAIFLSKKFGITFNLPPYCHRSLIGCYFFQPQSSPEILQVLGDVLSVIGLAIAIAARTTLGSNWSSTIDIKQGHELITRGIYRHIRHPIYSGVLLMLLGTVLVFPSIPETVTFLVITGFFTYRIKREEALMTETFPKEYPEYMKKTKRLIPFVW